MKINNDYRGHDRGDFLLKTLASKIKQVFNDIPDKEIARIDGDEFLIITKNVKQEVLIQKRDELLEACNNEDILNTVSVSVGLSYD